MQDCTTALSLYASQFQEFFRMNKIESKQKFDFTATQILSMLFPIMLGRVPKVIWVNCGQIFKENLGIF